MIDLHCHLLPGIDDGPANMEEAVALAARAASDGVRTVAATPHLRSDHPRVRVDELADRTRELQAELDHAGVNVEVVPAGEVDAVWASKASDEDLRLASYGQRGTDLLLETPYGFLPPIFEALVADLRDLGYRVMLAHPERNPTFQGDPDRLERLVRSGVLAQVGADSLIGTPRRSRRRRLGMRLIERDVAQVLASDAHGPHLARGPELSPAVALASRVAGARAAWMATDAPAAILEGRALPAAPQRARSVAAALGALLS